MENKKVILLKYGEVVLKGLNRSYFENLIVKRVKRVLKTLDGNYETYYAQSTLVVRGDGDMEAAAEVLRKVFGVVSVCVGIECEKDINIILKIIKENAEELIGVAKTFKCNAKRSDKNFFYKSPEISALCGEEILRMLPQLTVDVKNPDVCVTVEIRDRSAFIHGGGRKGAGGMPTGSAGRALLLLSGGIDSPVAGHMITKRGAEIDAVYFETPPYTGEAAFEKVTALARELALYTGRVYLHRVNVTDIQMQIAEKCDERMTTILLRRFMMKIAEKIAYNNGSAALITGESVGQVASQTMEALAVTNAAVSIPVYRPCIGLDKEEIVKRAREINTFEISSRPYEDCCSLFTPKHPNLRPTIAQAEGEEEKLDVKALIEEAFLSKTVTRVEADG